MSCQVQLLILLLHENEWNEGLLSEEYFPKSFLNLVLSRREKDLVDMKIQGISNYEISKFLKIKMVSVKRKLNIIKRKYEVGITERVDNLRCLRTSQIKKV